MPTCTKNKLCACRDHVMCTVAQTPLRSDIAPHLTTKVLQEQFDRICPLVLSLATQIMFPVDSIGK